MKFQHLLLGAACAVMSFSHAAAAPAECVYSLVGKLPLQYRGPGLAMTTSGSINGKPAAMVISSASNAILLTQGGMAQHKLKLRTVGGEVVDNRRSAPISCAPTGCCSR